jgi:hypothetical protein
MALSFLYLAFVRTLQLVVWVPRMSSRGCEQDLRGMGRATKIGICRLVHMRDIHHES